MPAIPLTKVAVARYSIHPKSQCQVFQAEIEPVLDHGKSAAGQLLRARKLSARGLALFDMPHAECATSDGEQNRGGTAPPTNGGDDQPRSGAGRRSSARGRKPQRDVLIGLAGACEFWHDANRVAFASFVLNGPLERWAVRSREFKIWLSGRFYAKNRRGDPQSGDRGWHPDLRGPRLKRTVGISTLYPHRLSWRQALLGSL